jgi:hypothetical protein
LRLDRQHQSRQNDSSVLHCDGQATRRSHPLFLLYLFVRARETQQCVSSLGYEERSRIRGTSYKKCRFACADSLRTTSFRNGTSCQRRPSSVSRIPWRSLIRRKASTRFDVLISSLMGRMRSESFGRDGWRRVGGLDLRDMMGFALLLEGFNGRERCLEIVRGRKIRDMLKPNASNAVQRFAKVFR